jgi:hypothetical protein
VLATSLTDPHHLPHGIIWEVYDQLSEWVEQVHIGPFKSIKNTAGHFVVNLQDSAGPIPYSKFDSASAGAEHRILDCSALQTLVQQHLDHLGTGGHKHESLHVSSNSARTVLTHLNRVWGLPPKRYFPRHHRKGTVNIASGFNVVYYYCNAEQEFAPNDGDNELADASYENVTEMAARYSKETWNLLNEGPGGYQAYTSEKPRSAVRVGELLGLQGEHMGDDEWVVGSVRWLMVQGDGSYKIGIQSMNQEHQLAAIRALDGTNLETEYRRAILLGGPDSESDFTIITTNQIYAEQRPLELNIDGNLVAVTADELLESTVAFQHFSVKR